MRENFAVTRVVDVGRVVIKGGHRGHHRRNHGHGMCVVMESLKKSQQWFADHGVPRDRIAKCIELRLRRQRAIDQQISDFHIAGALRQLLDGIAAVQEQPRIAVDIGDFTFGAGRGHETRVIREYPQISGEMRNIEHVGSESAGHDVQFSRSAGGGILEFVFRGGGHLACIAGEDCPPIAPPAQDLSAHFRYGAAV